MLNEREDAIDILISSANTKVPTYRHSAVVDEVGTNEPSLFLIFVVPLFAIYSAIRAPLDAILSPFEVLTIRFCCAAPDCWSMEHGAYTRD
jgi:hypothetical protein